MDKNKALEALKKIKQENKKRNFTQSVDFTINLKGLDLKKPENQIDLFVTLHFGKGKKTKVCALVGPELKTEAEKTCDKAISQTEFVKYAEKKLAKKLAAEFDFFIAQANIMPSIASSFGKIFGPRNKMPNPKAGCVVPPKFNLKPLYDRLQNTVRVSARTTQLIQCSVGNETMKDEEVVDNILSIYNAVIAKLPNEANNIKSMFLKLTMGKPIKIE